MKAVKAEPGKLTKVRPYSLEQWKKEAGRWRSSSFFQTPAWLQSLCDSFKEFSNRSVLLVGASGQPILLPLVENQKAPMLSTALSLPYGTYGGPLGEKDSAELDWDAVEIYFKQYHFAAENMTLPPGVKPPKWDAFHLRPRTTQILSLTEKYQDLVDNRFSSSCRRAVRKAERTQLEVIQLEADKHLDRFWELYEMSMRRWGRKKGFPKKLFEQLWRMEGVQFWGAVHREQLVTGALMLTSGEHQYYWLGVMDEQSQHFRPNNLLFSRLLEIACFRGIRTFDFGNSDGLIGVFNFKKSFGPDVVGYHQVYRAGPLVQGVHRLKGLLQGRAGIQ